MSYTHLSVQEAAAIVIARARDTMASPAAFDWHIACNGIGSRWNTELGFQVDILANEHLPKITKGAGEAALAEREQNWERLWNQLLPELEAYAQRCKSRRYTGWSNYSTGPIRYSS